MLAWKNTATDNSLLSTSVKIAQVCVQMCFCQHYCTGLENQNGCHYSRTNVFLNKTHSKVFISRKIQVHLSKTQGRETVLDCDSWASTFALGQSVLPLNIIWTAPLTRSVIEFLGIWIKSLCSSGFYIVREGNTKCKNTCSRGQFLQTL